MAVAVLTRNVATGEVTVQPDGSTNVVAVIAAPDGYEPGTCSEDASIWRAYQQLTNCPDCWGIEGAFPPPTISLFVSLADINDYAIYASNVEAEAEAAAATTASGDARATRVGGFTAMDDDAMDNGDPCTITNDAAPFSIVSLIPDPDGSGNMALTWQSCTDHIYVVQSEGSLTPTSSWTDVAWMFGTDQQTSWTDTNAVGLTQNFYQVVRANPTNLNNGVPYGWAVTYGLDPLDPNLASETSTNPRAYGLTNLQVYENPSVLISNNYDSVGDGIPDWWRVMYFGTTSTNDQSCASCDADNSFWSNLADYENGVNPTVTGAALPLTFTIDGGTNLVTSAQLNIQLASGIIADYVVIGEDASLTSSVTNAFSSSFEYTLQSNGDGLHAVYLQLLNTNGAASSPFATEVRVEQGAPAIWISSPINGTTTGQRQIDVQGFAGDANSNGIAPLQVTVNGDFVNGRDTNGNWWSAQDLTPGTNTFLAVATGVAGLATTNSVWIIYDPTLATNVPNFTLDVTNTVTVGSNTTAIAVSGTIDDSNATVQIIVLNASDNTITNALVNAAVLGTNWWGNVPVVAGNNAVIVSAQNSNSQPATNGFMTIENTNVFLEIDSPTADTDANGTSVLVVGHASTNFDQTITINGVPALTSTDTQGIIFSNSVPINSIDANIVEVDATGTDGSSATTRETIYGYELQAYSSHFQGTLELGDTWPPGDQLVTWDPARGNAYHVHTVAYYLPERVFDGDSWPDWNSPDGILCGSLNSGDVCVNFAHPFVPRFSYGTFEGDYWEPWYLCYWGFCGYINWAGSWDSQLTVIKHAPVDEEQLVVFHFTSFMYATYCANPTNFDP